MSLSKHKKKRDVNNLKFMDDEETSEETSGPPCSGFFLRIASAVLMPFLSCLFS